MSVSINGTGSITGIDQGFNVTGGSIGIGTDNPSAPLHLSGADATNAKIKIEDNNNGFAASEINIANGGRDLRIAAPQDIYFQDVDTGEKHLYIQSGGRIGIGTDVPTSDLHVHRSGSTSSIVDAAAGDALLTLRNAGDTNWSGINFARERSTGTNVTGGSIWMPSDTSNNSATLYIQTQSASAQAGADGALSNNNGVRLKLASQPGGNGNNSAFTVEVGDSERLRIRSDGKISTGTNLNTTNTYEFSVTGADGTGGFYAHGRNHYLSNRSNAYSSLTLKKANADSDGIDYLQLRDSNNILKGQITGAGNWKPISGGGIDFSAFGNAGGMTSELLDDYEEGTWTPTVYGGSTAGTFNIVSGGSNVGWYVKIGQYVHMIIRWQNVYLTGASGNLILGNLPFSFDNANARLGGFSTYLEGFTPSYNKSFNGSQSVCFRRANATAVTFRPSSSDEWDVYYNAASLMWQKVGGNSSQRTYGEIHLYGHTPS